MGRTKFFKSQDKGKEDFEKHVKKLLDEGHTKPEIMTMLMKYMGREALDAKAIINKLEICGKFVMADKIRKLK